MKIKQLHLYTHNPEAELAFYTHTLGFELIAQNSDSFSIRVGWSTLTFSRSEKQHVYH
jgi:catechol 2,3-dioxygenase-like lactoylglutathione lyase family enzyme